MKKLLTIGATLLMALAVINSEAQTDTNAPPLPPVATNGPSVGFFTDTINWLAEGSNFIVVPYGIVSSGNNNKYEAGGGVALAYSISQYVVTGMRMEYLNKDFYQASFNGQLQVPITLFKKVTVVPFVLGGVATPFGAGSTGINPVQGIVGAGMAVRLSSKWDLISDVEKWSAVPGQQYRFGIGFKF